jgi:hypothetical protein
VHGPCLRPAGDPQLDEPCDLAGWAASRSVEADDRAFSDQGLGERNGRIDGESIYVERRHVRGSLCIEVPLQSAGDRADRCPGVRVEDDIDAVADARINGRQEETHVALLVQ